MSTLISVNPATEEKLETYHCFEANELEEMLAKSYERFMTWRSTSEQERADHLAQAAEVLRLNQERYAQLMTREMGKPIGEARKEVAKCAWVCDYYSENGAAFLDEEVVETGAMKSKISYQPVGAILGIMPWNFPFWQVFRYAAPNLMAGNVVLLKHAPNVPGCAVALEQIFDEAGFPPSVFQNLMIKTDQVQAVIEDPRVQGVTLTGSHRAGAMVAAEAGKVTKKTVLELGGSDPYVILEDADLDLAAKVCAQSRLINSGQSCIAAKRFIVAESRRHEFEEKLVAAMQGYQMGPPDQDQTQIGPQARQDLQEKVERQVRETLKAGAQCLLGGKLEDSKGFYYPPTVLTDVRPGMAAFEEEVFGPVAAVISARNEVEAVQLANQSRFGLGAAVFTRDIPKGEFIATHELDAGNCTVNAMVQSDPRLPFGGIKQSGYGRELARAGMLEFVNIKSVVINE